MQVITQAHSRTQQAIPSPIRAYRIWCWLQPPNIVSDSNLGDVPSSTQGNAVYGALVLLGAGGTTLLVTALSLISDLIGDMKVRRNDVTGGWCIYGCYGNCPPAPSSAPLPLYME